MSVEEFFRRHPGPFTVDGTRHVLSSALTYPTKAAPSDAEAIAAALNDAFSRHPRDGERCCGTCAHLESVARYSEDDTEGVCSVLQALRSDSIRHTIVDIDNQGKKCIVWQRRGSK